MSLLFLRRPLLLALALGLGLAGCGGKAEFPVKGTITGLQYSGMVLTNNGGNDLPVAAGATSFTFPGAIEYGAAYDVNIKTPPLHQTCGRNNSTDTAGRQISINVEITCSLVVRPLGGTITGLTVDGLELNNGSEDRIAPLKDATSYQFRNPIAYGTSYSVTVLKQPPGLRCTVVNAGGEMADFDVANVNVSCVPV